MHTHIGAEAQLLFLFPIHIVKRDEPGGSNAAEEIHTNY